MDELLTEINSVMKFKHLQEGIRILVEEPESVLPLKILDTAFGLHRYCPMQENTQLREHVDAVVEQAEAGTEFGRDQVREIMNALRVSVAFVTQSFRLLRSLCSPKLHFSVQGAQEDWEPQIRWSLKSDGEMNGMRHWGATICSTSEYQHICLRVLWNRNPDEFIYVYFV